MTLRYRFVWSGYLVWVGAAALLYLWIGGGWLQNALYDAHATASLIAMACLVSRTGDPTQRRAWAAFTLGFAFWVAGDLYYNLVQPGDAVFSVVDLLYFAGYGFLAVGLLLLAAPRRADRFASLMDSLIVAGSVSLLGWGLLIDPIADQSAASTVERLAASAYPACDLLLLTLAARLVVREPQRAATRLVAAGVLLTLVGDAAWRGYVLAGSWSIGSPINAFYVVGYGCFAAAMLHPSARASVPGTSRRLPRGWQRLGLFGLAVPAVPLAPLLVVNGFDGADAVAMSVGGGVLCVALVARLVRMVIVSENLAAQDSLTGLPNRRMFEDALAEAVRSAASGRPGALILIDVDNLKLVNDVAGHQTGDQLLRWVATILREAVRPEDTIARIGGDEFAVIAPGVTPEDAKVLGERLVTQIAEMRYMTKGLSMTHTVSAGVTLLAGASGGAVYAAADAALYEAKVRGRNRLISAADGAPSTAQLLRASSKASELREALADDRLVCFLQPIVSIPGGSIQGYEALARILGAQGTLVEPSSFIPAAEAFGLVPAIDRRILEAVLDHLEREPGLRISSNLSTESFLDETITQLLAERLPSIGRGRLMLEITESTAMAGLEQSPERLQRLRELGCWIALDDFGEGFSSFAQLAALPVDMVKIPRSLTRRIADDAAGRAVVQGIIATVHALDKEVICEGIENRQLAQLLQQLGVDFGQGYFWGKPRPVRAYLGVQHELAAASAEITPSGRITGRGAATASRQRQRRRGRLTALALSQPERFSR